MEVNNNCFNKIAISFVLIFTLFFSLTYWPTYNDGPRGIHQWAQADRLAVCLRYIDGKSLNDPATLSFKTPDGNVGVEFSGYQYLLAQIVRAGYPEQWLPLLFKCLTFFIFYTSIFVLTFEILKFENIGYRICILIGLMSSPLLVYYGYNFLPDILALSLMLWCFYLYHKNLEQHIYWIIIIAGLAMFIKTSSGIYLMSFYGVFFLKNILKINWKFLMVTSLFLAIILSIAYYDYYWVNQRNMELYSVVFLSSPIPVTSWDQLLTIFDVAKRFRYDYFNGSQQVVIITLCFLGLSQIKKWNFRNQDFLLSGLVTLGIFCIILLFGIQYMNHDYYFIGNFMPILLFLSLRSIAYFTPYIQPRTGLFLAILFATISFSQGNSRYFQRMAEVVTINGNPEPYPFRWLEHSKDKITPFVNSNELVYVVYVPEPNHALVYLRRNGATFNEEEMSREQSPFNYYLEIQKTKYVMCKKDKIQQFRRDQPQFFESAHILFDDKEFILFSL